MRKVLVSLMTLISITSFSQRKIDSILKPADTTWQRAAAIPKDTTAKHKDSVYFLTLTRDEAVFLMNAIGSLDEKPSNIRQYQQWFYNKLQLVPTSVFTKPENGAIGTSSPKKKN